MIALKGNPSFVRRSIFIITAVIFNFTCQSIYCSAFDNFKAETLVDDEIINYYKYIPFGYEFEGLGRDSNIITKRNQDRLVNIITLPQPSAPVSNSFAAVRAVAEDLEARSNGVRIKIYSPEEIRRWNAEGTEYKSKMFSDVIAIYIGSRGELSDLVSRASENSPKLRESYEELLRQNPASGHNFCSVIIWPRGDSGSEIGLATAFIESGPRLEACLYEEIMQSFGIANDFPAGTPSIFNDDNSYDLPTDLDWQLWRIHTDPLLKAGMKQLEALEIVRKILSVKN